MFKPARKLKCSKVKNIHRFPSTKTDGNNNILVESVLESQFCLHLEFDPSVSRYYPQPETFQVPISDRNSRQYTPDFEVHYTSGEIKLIEVKPLERIDTEDNLELFSNFKLLAESMGIEFKIVNDAEICQEILLGNYKKLLKYRVRPFLDKRNLVRCAEIITTPIPLRQLIEELKIIASLKEIYTWIAFGYLRFDIESVKLNLCTEVHFDVYD